jgi:hypothetical protein
VRQCLEHGGLEVLAVEVAVPHGRPSDGGEDQSRWVGMLGAVVLDVEGQHLLEEIGEGDRSPAPIGLGLAEAEAACVDHPTFTINPPSAVIAAQIKEWEPRAQVTAVEAPQGEDMTLANIIVRVVTGTM